MPFDRTYSGSNVTRGASLYYRYYRHVVPSTRNDFERTSAFYLRNLNAGKLVAKIVIHFYNLAMAGNPVAMEAVDNGTFLIRNKFAKFLLENKLVPFDRYYEDVDYAAIILGHALFKYDSLATSVSNRSNSPCLLANDRELCIDDANTDKLLEDIADTIGCKKQGLLTLRDVYKDLYKRQYNQNPEFYNLLFSKFAIDYLGGTDISVRRISIHDVLCSDRLREILLPVLEKKLVGFGLNENQARFYAISLLRVETRTVAANFGFNNTDRDYLYYTVPVKKLVDSL